MKLHHLHNDLHDQPESIENSEADPEESDDHRHDVDQNKVLKILVKDIISLE